MAVNETNSHRTRLGRWAYVAASLLLLAPCCWQERVQAGDLSSHIYNAWLAQSIQSGRLRGLAIVPQWTNVLFDLLLAHLLQHWGAAAAQRVATALAVLVFTWGAFAFAGAVAGRRPWHILPWIAMLAYGWVYHMGFFNFYLSLGLCFWALALVWKWSARRAAVAAAILAVAFAAHALPVAWTVCLLAYGAVAGRLSAKWRAATFAASLAAMALLHAAVASRVYTTWSVWQITLVTGLDQVVVFDVKYLAAGAGLLLVWTLSLRNLGGARRRRDFHPALLRAASGIPQRIGISGAANVPGGGDLPLCGAGAGAAPKVGALCGNADGTAVFRLPLHRRTRAERFRGRHGASGGDPAAGPAGGKRVFRSRFEGLGPHPHDRPGLRGPLLQLCKLRTFFGAVPHPGDIGE